MRHDTFRMDSKPVLALLTIAVIVLWGMTAWLRILAEMVPPLELTGIALAGAAISAILIPGSPRSYAKAVRAHPWYAWLIIVGSLIGSSAFFFVALARAPAAQVVVITYSWPLLFAISSDLYRRQPPTIKSLLALLVGMVGVAVIQGMDQMPSADAWLGYLAALASGLCWVAYSLFVQIYPRPLNASYPAFFFISSVLTLVLQQLLAGGLIWPSTSIAWLASLFLGIGPYGLGFLAWGHVVRHGNPQIVPVLPYAVPAVSAIILVLVGMTPPTFSLAAGCALVMLACSLSVPDKAAA